MSSDAEANSAQSDETVVSVITILLSEPHSPKLTEQAIEVLRGECNDIAGFISGEVLLSRDIKKLAIVTEWSDSHAWSLSRYDVRVGNMLEVCLANATVLDFELYHRKARFSADSSNGASASASSLNNEEGTIF